MGFTKQKNMFLEEKRLIDAIWKTRSSVSQHVKRAIYHGRCGWVTSLEFFPLLTSPDAYEDIWTTRSSFFQHVKRAIYHSGWGWVTRLGLVSMLTIPDAYVWRKEKYEPLQPFWTTLCEASSPYQELIHYWCKKQYRCLFKWGKSALRLWIFAAINP